MDSLYDILKAGFEVRLKHEPDRLATRIRVSKQDCHKEWMLSGMEITQARLDPDIIIFTQVLRNAKAVDKYLADEVAKDENPT